MTALVKVLLPVGIIQITDTDTIRGGRMGEQIVFQVNADMRDFPFAIGKEKDVALLKLGTGNEVDIAKDIVGGTVKIDTVDLTIDNAYKG